MNPKEELKKLKSEQVDLIKSIEEKRGHKDQSRLLIEIIEIEKKIKVLKVESKKYSHQKLQDRVYLEINKLSNSY